MVTGWVMNDLPFMVRICCLKSPKSNFASLIIIRGISERCEGRNRSFSCLRDKVIDMVGYMGQRVSFQDFELNCGA